MWICGGNGEGTTYSDVQSSTDGINWTQETIIGFDAVYGHQLVVKNNTIYVLGGRNASSYNNFVKKSIDGKNWSVVSIANPFTAICYHQATLFNGSIFVHGGSDGSSLNVSNMWKSN
jgi:hypothetical protein